LRTADVALTTTNAVFVLFARTLSDGEPAALLTPVPTSTREQLVAAGRLVAAKRTFDRPPRPPRTIVSSTADELVELDRSAAR